VSTRRNCVGFAVCVCRADGQAVETVFETSELCVRMPLRTCVCVKCLFCLSGPV
jgi:hypothetical protein